MAKFIIGIDEVGRGALAGPVVVAAALVRSDFRATKVLGNLRDSKKLSAEQREAWFAYLKTHPQISYAAARVYPRGIERMNISAAANLAAQRAHKKLLKKKRGLTPFSTSVFLDGGLFLGSRARQPNHAKTIVKADEKIKAVAIASIIAKVIRDRFMVKLAKRHTIYGFEIHKGYATKVHRNAIKKFGPCIAHRTTFLKGLLKP